MINNTEKRNQISDVTFVIKARGNKVAVAVWDKNSETANQFRTKELANSTATTPAILLLAGFHIRNQIEEGFKGQIGLVISDDAALKAFALQSRINKSGLEAAENFVDNNLGFSWMSEDGKMR